MSGNVFNIPMNIMVIKPTYIIGVDTLSDGIYSYCLTKQTKEGMEVLLSKVISNKDIFDDEVNNIRKYFNAKLIKV